MDLIPSDFLFCELQPCLLKFFPLLNNKRCFQHGIRSSSSNREAPAPSSPSATEVRRLKLNRTQASLLGRDLNPAILSPILNNKTGLRGTSRVTDPCSHPALCCAGWLIFSIKSDATTSSWLLSCITGSPPSRFPLLNLAEKSHKIRLRGWAPHSLHGKGFHISAADGPAQDFCHWELWPQKKRWSVPFFPPCPVVSPLTSFLQTDKGKGRFPAAQALGMLSTFLRRVRLFPAHRSWVWSSGVPAHLHPALFLIFHTQRV